MKEILENGTKTMRIYGTIARDTPEELSYSEVIMTVYGLCGGLFVCLVFLLSNKHRLVGISCIGMYVVSVRCNSYIRCDPFTLYVDT